MRPTCQSHTSLCPLSLVCPSATGTAPLFPSASGDDGGALAHGCRGRGGAERCSTLSRRRTISTTATARRLAAAEEGEPSVAAVEDERRARFAPTVVGVLAKRLPPSPREPWKEGGESRVPTRVRPSPRCAEAQPRPPIGRRGVPPSLAVHRRR